MFPEKFFSEEAEGISFSRQQASDFAKRVADDFNPIHDPDSKLFCVPGDLLFAVVLSRYGLSSRMRFRFAGMVGDGQVMSFVERGPGEISLEDTTGKQYLLVERSGNSSTDRRMIEGLTRAYVSFSGHNFPDILVPLMSSQGVMLNPSRPLVIYSGMEIELDTLEISPPELLLTEKLLEVSGNRGEVRLRFELQVDGRPVGQGIKHMQTRGLRPLQREVVDRLVAAYLQRKGADFD